MARPKESAGPDAEDAACLAALRGWKCFWCGVEYLDRCSDHPFVPPPERPRRERRRRK